MKISVVGGYGVGMTMRLATVPGPGETVTGATFAFGPGGKGSNQAVAAARLGARVSLLTAVGPDFFAADARRLWAEEGVDDSSVMVGQNPTMVGFIMVEPNGENRIAIAPGALDELDAESVESYREKIRESDLVIISMEVPMAVVLATLRIANEEGTTSLLNPAPATRLPDEAWALIDFLTPNQTEAPILLGLTDDVAATLEPSELLKRLRAKFEGVVVLTLGSQGALISSGSDIIAVAAMPASRVVDTTGAGDTFTAALAVALVEGMPIKDASVFASAAGCYAVGREGVIPSLPTRNEITSMIGNSR